MRNQRWLLYLYAILAVGATLGLRLLLIPFTGTGAPFSFFFTVVLITSMAWGAGPGLLSGFLSAPIAGYLFAYDAGYSALEATAQTFLFLIETGIVCVLVARLRRANAQVRALADRVGKSQRLFQGFLDFSPNVVFIKGLDNTFLVFSRRGAELAGVTPSEAVGKTHFDLFPPVVARDLQQKDEAVFRSCQALTSDETMELKDGVHHFLSVRFPYFDSDGRLLGLCGIFVDNTERKRAEEALKVTDAELKEAQRVAHIGNWRRDAKGDVVFWSEELYRIFGLDSRIPPPGLSQFLKVYMPETRARLAPLIERVLREGVPYEIETEVRHPDGTTRWVASRAEAVRDASGQIVGLRGTSQDISELKRLETMREEWTAVIAHDLRQPIGVIGMAARVLRMIHSGEMIEKENDIISRIESAVSNLARMVDDLLDVSRLESRRLTLNRAWVNVSDMAKEVIDHLSHMTAGFRVTISEKADLTRVCVDPARLEQIIGNLISNAAKYGEKGTEIHVGIEEREDEVRISITNHGRGIPADEIPHLFQRFSRASASRRSSAPGLGLGLYITKGLVNAHGGRIWVESAPGKTTTFTFTLPTRLNSGRTAA